MGQVRERFDRLRAAEGVLVMGVVNVTPDSFSDGGRYVTAEAARARVDEVAREGAVLVDVGGESTRPGAAAVSAQEQLARLEAALRHAVARRDLLVSVDTTLPEVAERALAWGAHFVNDTSCLADPELARVTARHGGGLIVMHSRGSMSAMRGFSEWPDADYADVVGEVAAELRDAGARACAAGLDPCELYVDPGLGFAKNARQSLALLGRLGELGALGAPLVVGPSRKSFLASLDPAPPGERLGGTVAACLAAALRGAAVLRVHDVRAVRQALALARTLGDLDPRG